MIDSLVWGILLRCGQIAIEASSTFLCGLLVAGVMRRMLGADGTRKLFGGRGWNGLFRAWAVGTLLPVCSLGVIPIARELRRAGVPSGTILAFVLAAPHINPLSLLYGLTLSEPLVIISFALASLVVALIAGASWERFFARESDAPPPSHELMPPPGPKRLIAVIVTAAREMVGPSTCFVLLGLVTTGMIAGLLPHGCLGTSMKHKDVISPLLMTVIALPLYSGPLQGMMRLGLMFEHGNSVGAAFALFELGIGVNLGLIVWLGLLFGWRRVLLWFILVASVTLVLAYASESPLYFAHEEAGHTHAFDEWTNPFISGFNVSWLDCKEKLMEKMGELEIMALGGLLMLALIGGLLSFDRSGRVEAWLTAAPHSTKPKSVLNRSVPGPVLGVMALLGLVVFSIVALYVYYPPPDKAFEEIVQVRTEAVVAVITGNKEEAIRRIQHWDLLTRKLQVGVFIRTGHMEEEAGKLTEDLREELETLRDAILAGDLTSARAELPKVEVAYKKCRDAYLRPVSVGMNKE